MKKKNYMLIILIVYEFIFRSRNNNGFRYSFKSIYLEHNVKALGLIEKVQIISRNH